MSDFFADEIARWMFFLAGVALLVAVFILPATADLRSVRDIRDEALVSETHHQRRVTRYEGFLDAVRSDDPSTIELLAQSQLGVIPSDREALILPGRPDDPMVFELLEPPTVELVAPVDRSSRLERLTTLPISRGIVLVVGAAAVLIGILPASKPRDDGQGDDRPRARRSVLRLVG